MILDRLMAFNLVRDSGADGDIINDAADLYEYFGTEILNWLNALPNWSVQYRGSNDYSLTCSKTGMNTDTVSQMYYRFGPYDADLYQMGLRMDFDGTNTTFGDTSIIDCRGYLAQTAAGGTANNVMRMWVSDIDPTSWVMTINNYVIGVDPGDNFFKISPTSGSHMPQWNPWIASYSGGISSVQTAWNIGAYDEPGQLANISMLGTYCSERNQFEAGFSTDVVTMGYRTTSDLNMCVLGARADIRQRRMPIQSYNVFDEPITVFQDGDNYWISTRAAYQGLMFDVGTVAPPY
jgi:hypothetical protein